MLMARLRDAWFSETAIGQAERIPESEGRTEAYTHGFGTYTGGFTQTGFSGVPPFPSPNGDAHVVYAER